MKKGPGKSYRDGISLIELMDMFPNEEAAVKWFEQIIWPNGSTCPRCGSEKISSRRKPQPYRCRTCLKDFSVRHGAVMQHSRLSLQKWAFAIYMVCTNLKSISSMKLHRDLKITQKSAWFLMHRIREAFPHGFDPFAGPVEVDETYVGGKRKNMSKRKREDLSGRGPSGKVAVVGVKDRKTNKVVAQVVENTDAETLQDFVLNNTNPDAKVYTDDARA